MEQNYKKQLLAALFMTCHLEVMRNLEEGKSYCMVHGKKMPIDMEPEKRELLWYMRCMQKPTLNLYIK